MFQKPAQGHNIGWGVQWTSELIHWAQSTCQVQNNQKKVWEICLRCILLWALHTVDNTTMGLTSVVSWWTFLCFEPEHQYCGHIETSVHLYYQIEIIFTKLPILIMSLPHSSSNTLHACSKGTLLHQGTRVRSLKITRKSCWPNEIIFAWPGH